MKSILKYVKTICLSLVLMLPGFVGMAQHPAFPLKISPDKRYFVDQKGTPFLYNADTGWQIFCKLTTGEAREYLTTRKNQGFNTIQTQLAMFVNLKNRDGNYIFDGDNDFSRPNEAFHHHILEVIHIADSLGLMVVMSQPWVGCCLEAFGGSLDKPIRMNGAEKNRNYGKYLGKKFAGCNNLFWIIGGDNDPRGDLAEIEAFAGGLRETAPAHQLLTYHASATHSSTDIFQHAKWLGFSMVYTYWKDKWNDNPAKKRNLDQMPEVYEVSLKEYNKSFVMPFILGESQYEGFSGNDNGTPEIVRRQFYWVMLSGGAGHAYGSQIWNFPPNWRDILKWPGAQQVQYANKFFNSIAWWQLVPDQIHDFVLSGYGTYSKTDYATAAITKDKKTAALYMFRSVPVSVNLSQLKGSKITAQWFNPRTGEYISKGEHKPGKVEFIPPTNEDWALLFKAE
ncbi:MAG: glycoside hydrolase family 140 protein [Prolixibacteraceae bacterium]|jgi:hypothetical protein|nr:glycoside hydrolase family 140 protein [Prolixibacteraceae bacterium]